MLGGGLAWQHAEVLQVRLYADVKSACVYVCTLRGICAFTYAHATVRARLSVRECVRVC